MDCSCEYERIRGVLKDIFKKRFGIDLNALDEGIFEKELLGREVGFEPRDLVYLFFDIEKAFNIKIPEESIADGKFNNLSNITQIIYNETCKSGMGSDEGRKAV